MVGQTHGAVSLPAIGNGGFRKHAAVPCAPERRWQGARRARSGTPDPALHCAGQPGFHRVCPFRCTRHCTLLFQLLAAHPPPREGLVHAVRTTMSRTVCGVCMNGFSSAD